ncbi:Immunoglobulin V-set domain protein, partial [Trichostrongylus colubriformis]
NSYAGEYECRGYRNNELIASSSVQVYSSTDPTEEVKVEIEPPRVRIVSQGESIVLKCDVEDPKSSVIWYRTENLTDALMVGSSQFHHLHNVDVCDRGVYYCTDEFTNYAYPHSTNMVIVVPHSLLGSVSFTNVSACNNRSPYHDRPTLLEVGLRGVK